MDPEDLISFKQAAGAGLASVRGSLLITARSGDGGGLVSARAILAGLKENAERAGLSNIADLAIECELSIDALADAIAPDAAFAALDVVTRIEAALFDLDVRSDEFSTDISEFVDASFDGLLPESADDVWEEEFEIDEETLEIFRGEADELIANIFKGVATLASSPSDQNALWEIRRNAHTLKGAAGIVGLTDAAKTAHQMEDLLDQMVETRRDAAPAVVDFLDAAVNRLDSIVKAKIIEGDDLGTKYDAVAAWLASPAEGASTGSANHEAAVSHTAAAAERAITTPIVRVSLDRLDEIIKLSRSLLINRSAVAERFAQTTSNADLDADALATLESLLTTQKRLADEIQAKLLQIRMVKFGMLETRLSRAVNVTCIDENKKATVYLENGEVEIDTQVIDALIEPLLHLLKNAVVHGIEPPETRRFIGKPERGSISIRIEADTEAMVLTVTDDGGGISAAKLKDKAVAAGIVDAEKAGAMSDRDALKLVFDRGLTTAEKLDMNAGRGVGMSIVKDAVESRGGKVLVESQLQQGTTFTILMPLAASREDVLAEDPVIESETNEMPLVLIVDDSASIRRRTTKLVEAAGLRVITAQNGAEALELLLSSVWEPDLILSDVEMPQIDGWELLEYIKTDTNLGHIPVVMVTSLDTDEHRTRAFSLGASDYLVKPFGVDSLEKILASFCSVAA